MRIRVSHSIEDLASDLAHIARTAGSDMVGVVREGIRVGNTVAKDSARAANKGGHAREYASKFKPEMHGVSQAFGVLGYSGEYGPVAEGQGELAHILENGQAGKNAPQNNLAKSADLIGPSFAQEVHNLPDRWFWRNG